MSEIKKGDWECYPMRRRGIMNEGKEIEIVNLALGRRYGIQTIARRTGVLPAEVSAVLGKNKIIFHPSLNEWRRI